MPRAQAQTARKITLDSLETPHVPHIASRDTAQHPISQSAWRTAEDQAFSPASATSRNKCISAIHSLNQAVDFFWSVLKVAIHHYHHITATCLNSRVHRSALPTVTRKKHTTERRKLLAQITNQSFGTVS
jgi:hypothetical protein